MTAALAPKPNTGGEIAPNCGEPWLAWDLLNRHSICCIMKATCNPQARSGFSLLEIMIVVAIIALLTALAVPNFARARDASRLNMIYGNLRALDAAKDRWALENNKATGTPIDDINVLTNYFRWGGICEVIHETYVPNAVGTRCQANLPPGVALKPYGPGASIPAP